MSAPAQAAECICANIADTLTTPRTISINGFGSGDRVTQHTSVVVLGQDLALATKVRNVGVVSGV